MWVLRNGLCLTRAVSHMHPSAVQRQINLAENLKSIFKKKQKKNFHVSVAVMMTHTCSLWAFLKFAISNHSNALLIPFKARGPLNKIIASWLGSQANNMNISPGVCF